MQIILSDVYHCGTQEEKHHQLTLAVDQAGKDYKTILKPTFSK